MAENLKTTYVSQLDEMTSISADDLILVSQLNTSKSSVEYASKKISYGTLSGIMLNGIDDKIANGIDARTKDLSDAISANYDAISALNEKEKNCESAIIKVANCVNQAKHDIQVLSSKIYAKDNERLTNYEQLCNAIHSTSSYLSTAIIYVSGQVDSNHSAITNDIAYLSTQHNVLSTQLSNQLSTKILQLSNCVSSDISVLSDGISAISGSLDTTRSEINTLRNELSALADDIGGYDYSDDIDSLKFNVFDNRGNVGILCAQIEDIKESLDEEKNYVKFWGIFNSFDDIGDVQAKMSEGDIIVVGDVEYYLDDRGSLQSFGSETSAQYWNDTHRKVDLSAQYWNDTYRKVDLSAGLWNKAVDDQLKISVLTKSELNDIDDPDSKTIYFCTDSD